MHEVQITLQTDQVTDIPVRLTLIAVWNQQWSDDHFREDRSGESVEEEPRLRNHQELYGQR